MFTFHHKPFKAHLRREYDNWMENAQKHYTKFGNLKAPSKTDMCNFVVKAWKEGVSQEVIVKSFVVCGIAKNTSPDQISCLKEDKPAHEALPVVLEGWTITQDFV